MRSGRLPTPPVPPTTRTSFVEEGVEGEASRSWVESEVEDSTTFSLTAFNLDTDGGGTFLFKE